MNTYRITLPWPPSNNRYYRHNRGRTHISTEGQAYRDRVAQIIKDGMLDVGITAPAKVHIECHMPVAAAETWTTCRKRPLTR